MAEFQLLVSEHGTHTPDQWAVATTKQVFPVEDAKFTGDKLVDAHRKELALIELFSKHHAWHQSDEKTKLAANAEHIVSPLKTDAKSIVSKVIEIMDGSSWQDHFSQPEVQSAVESVISSHTLTNRDVERSWHADTHPHCEYARQYKDAR